MNRFSMLSTGPKQIKRVPPPGAPSSVAGPSRRKPAGLSVTPKPASTRMYGKQDQAVPGAGLFGDMEKPNV